jgi:hypothetical protein
VSLLSGAFYAYEDLGRLVIAGVRDLGFFIKTEM